VIEGDMAGIDTTIIVQFFGTKYTDLISEPLAIVGMQEEGETSDIASSVQTPVPSPSPTVEPTPEATSSSSVVVGSSPPKKPISPFDTTKTASLIVVSTLIVVLVADTAIVSKKRIKRIGGRTFAHISFLGMILSIILILKAGQIL